MKDATEEKKVSFLDKKGVTKEEQAEAFRRAGLAGVPPSISPLGEPSSYCHFDLVGAAF